jgi:hypothetical protein
MQILNRHILWVGRLFLVLFFVANAGFTVVERYCTMALENHGDACTDDDDACSAATCDHKEAPQSANAPAIMDNMLCHVVSIVGGLQSNPTIVEKESNARTISVHLLVAPVPDLTVCLQVDRSPRLFSAASANVLPRSVETYVLNSTFLI